MTIINGSLYPTRFMNLLGLLFICKKSKGVHIAGIFCPRRLNKFDFVASNDASGGLLMIWNDSMFTGNILHNGSSQMFMGLAHLMKELFF